MLKKVSLVLLIIGFVALVGKGWHWTKDGFSILRTNLPLSETSFDRVDDPEILQALKQRYYYLGRGHQCYAFESEDGSYVLKLPRSDRYLIPFWLKACTFSFFDPYREALRQDKDRRLRFMLGSFQIAFNELRQETALLYLHLNQTDCFDSYVTIHDRIGRAYQIDLDTSSFVLQRKKPLMMPAFQRALNEGDRATAQEILKAFLKVVKVRAEKGIFNKDPSFLKNFAFDDGKGIQIDIGSFYHLEGVDSKAIFQLSFLQTVGHVERWLNGVDPEMARWFSEQTEKIARM